MSNSPEHYLDNDAAAGRVMAHARLLMALGQRLEKLLPPGLAAAARVANYKSGKIVIHADNGAVAAKIRQMGRRLCNELSGGGAECNDIEVKVQPRQIPCGSMGSTQKPLSVRTLGLLRSTAEKLPEGPLRAALARLMNQAARQE
ncbi:MAG: DciA family protein [Betaproteobacteria bacterium]|jgi:hypothetical protein